MARVEGFALFHPFRVYGGFPKFGVPTIMENQMEKKMENEMETGIVCSVWQFRTPSRKPELCLMRYPGSEALAYHNPKLCALTPKGCYGLELG